jgi:hypothetical protein
MDPSCLLRMTTQLTGFHLSDVHIWDGQPPAPHGQASTVRASQLLRVLARLSELRTLELDGVSCEWPEQQLSLYSAMITSTNLQRLIVRTGMETEGWEQVFPAGCKLPHLRTLLLDRLADDECESLESLSPETLARLGSCCPGLQQLRFIAPPVDSVAALRALTALTQLDVRGAEPRIVDDLTALTQLQDLRLVAAWYWGDEDQDWTLHHLVSLAALTSLTSLECPADQEVEEEGVLEHRFVNKVSTGRVIALGVQRMLEWALSAKLQGFWCFRAGVTNRCFPASTASQLTCLLSGPTVLTVLPCLCFVVCMCDQAPDGAPPDVWVQLLEHCAQYEVAPLPDIRPLVRQLRQLQEQRAVAKAAGTGLPAGFEEACEELEAKLDEAAALQGPQG